MTAAMDSVRVFGVLPAAGMSRRMGRTKQSLPYRDTTMAGRVARTMLAADLHAIAVVTRSELVPEIDLPKDDRLFLAINDDAASQMLDSVRIGLARLDEAFGCPPDAGLLVTPADIPDIPAEVIRSCIERFRRDPTRIVVATCNGRRGHPIIFRVGLRDTLDDLSGGLNELAVRRADVVTEVAYDNPAILNDVDTPADYENLAR